jgi:hypothetical protein
VFNAHQEGSSTWDNSKGVLAAPTYTFVASTSGVMARHNFTDSFVKKSKALAAKSG